jgi:hypothetical protein
MCGVFLVLVTGLPEDRYRVLVFASRADATAETCQVGL